MKADGVFIPAERYDRACLEPPLAAAVGAVPGFLAGLGPGVLVLTQSVRVGAMRANTSPRVANSSGDSWEMKCSLTLATW